MPPARYSGSYVLDFEQPVVEIERQLDALEARPDAALLREEIVTLYQTRDSLLAKAYQNLTPWQTVRVARHPARPQTLDYVDMICRDWCQLHGDRRYGDDPAIVTGFGRIGSVKCL
ncbi:MAG: acetyl-CoA carboxylase carboxyl transferase subunit alpha, partial [Phycisphaerae bacterium]|nr:acetyl-CoA carboxylase carboxyl transferase subunit alpha [Phycisphaerae bacterium]